MGDFYELFFEDAVDASRALGITLTKRGQHLGQDIPMCGVPVHAADDYLQKLIALGFRVAVCEQTEDPAEAKKRGSKSVVRRDVTRLVTPGTLTEEKLLDPVAVELPDGLGAGQGRAKRSTGWPGSTFPPGRSMSAKAGWRGCWPTSRGSSRAS
jgi:DNA mismatch repair protein MutS